MRISYWVKFRNHNPVRYESHNFIEFWELIKKHMMEGQLQLDWIIDA